MTPSSCRVTSQRALSIPFGFAEQLQLVAGLRPAWMGGHNGKAGKLATRRHQLLSLSTRRPPFHAIILLFVAVLVLLFSSGEHTRGPCVRSSATNETGDAQVAA
jgi:hypothetical protein